MLHYSNASSREKNRRYLVIKGGLPGCSGKEGSSTQSSIRVAAASVSKSSKRRGGRNNKYNANIRMTMHDMTTSVARGCPNAVVGDTGEAGKHPGKYSQCFAFSDR